MVPNAEPERESRTGNGSGTKLGGIIAVMVMLFVLSRIGIPASLLKNFMPLGARRAMADLCDECGGDGKTETSCIKCFGRGYYRGVNCTECSKSGKIEQECRFCGGSGKKPKP